MTYFGEDFDEKTIHCWVEELGELLNLNLVYNTALHQKLLQQYHKYTSVLKKKRMGEVLVGEFIQIFVGSPNY